MLASLAPGWQPRTPPGDSQVLSHKDWLVVSAQTPKLSLPCMRRLPEIRVLFFGGTYSKGGRARVYSVYKGSPYTYISEAVRHLMRAGSEDPKITALQGSPPRERQGRLRQEQSLVHVDVSQNWGVPFWESL